jgi:hypothetical protein
MISRVASISLAILAAFLLIMVILPRLKRGKQSGDR